MSRTLSTRRAVGVLLLTSALGACATNGAPSAPDAPGVGSDRTRFRSLANDADERPATPAPAGLGTLYDWTKERAVERPEITPRRIKAGDETVRALSGGRVLSIYFDEGAVTPIVNVDTRLRILKLLPYAGRIEIRGRTDGIGAHWRNERVAFLRAESIKRYLIARGVPSHMIAISYRPSGDYAGDVATERGRRLSRRADIEFVPPVDADRSDWLVVTDASSPWR